MNRFFQALLHPAEDADPQLRSELRGMMPGMLVEQFASTLLDNVNVIVMGLIGNAAIAGVSQVGTINYILMIVFQAFAMGGTALVAQAAGAKQDRRCRRMAGAALLLGLTISGVIALLMFFLRAPLVELLFGSAEPEVVTNSLLYYGFTALSPPLWFVYFQCSGFMRSCGDTRRPMMVSIFSNVVGILGNLLFTMHLQMGVSGAGLSYLLSVGSGAAAALGLVLRRNFYARPSFRLDRTTLADIGRVSHISTPTALENLLFNGTRLVLQVFLAGMGAVVISANQVFNSITNLLFIPFMAVNFLTAPLTGRTAGRGGVTAVRPCVGYLYRIGRSIAVWTAAAALLLATPLTLLFCRDAQVIPLVEHMVMLYAPFILFLPGCFILPNGFKAVGDARYAMIFSSVSAWAIRVGGMWLLGLRLGLGTMAIVLTQGLDHFARHVAYKRRYRGDLWLRELTAEHHKTRQGGNVMEDINRSFAALIVTQVCAVQPGERVLIELTDPDEGMGAELIRAVHRVGGRPFYHQMRDALEAAWISCADEDTIRHQADWDRQRMEQMDVFISLRRSENPCDMTEVPVEQAQLYRSLYTRPVHFETRLPHTRWLAMALPSPAMAQAAGMSTRDLYQFYYDSCLIDYRQFHRRMMPLAELMTQTDQVRITGPQMELQFSVRDMGVSICHGTRNIPAGEVFTAPVPDSVEGHIRYNVPTRWEGQLFTGVTLIFSHGRIVDASCEIGDRERLMQILDTDAGARHIGEFAMGTNPFIHRITSDILFDEKAAGSFHFTPGNSYGPSNKSRIHWDMVRRMQPEYGGGDIYFDGVLVQRDGLFVLPELLPLNPENLKRELAL